MKLMNQYILLNKLFNRIINSTKPFAPNEVNRICDATAMVSFTALDVDIKFQRLSGAIEIYTFDGIQNSLCISI